MKRPKGYRSTETEKRRSGAGTEDRPAGQPGARLVTTGRPAGQAGARWPAGWSALERRLALNGQPGAHFRHSLRRVLSAQNLIFSFWHS